MYTAKRGFTPSLVLVPIASIVTLYDDVAINIYRRDTNMAYMEDELCNVGIFSSICGSRAALSNISL